MFCSFLSTLRDAAYALAGLLALRAALQHAHDVLDGVKKRSPALILGALLLALAQPAFAADGDVCASCSRTPNQRVAYIIDSMSDSGVKIESIVHNPPGEWSNTLIRLVNWPAGCPKQDILIEETDEPVITANTVWHTVGTITGPVSPDTSGLNPKRWVGPMIRATYADVTNALCTDIDLVYRNIP